MCSDPRINVINLEAYIYPDEVNVSDTEAAVALMDERISLLLEGAKGAAVELGRSWQYSFINMAYRMGSSPPGRWTHDPTLVALQSRVYRKVYNDPTVAGNLQLRICKIPNRIHKGYPYCVRGSRFDLGCAQDRGPGDHLYRRWRGEPSQLPAYLPGEGWGSVLCPGVRVADCVRGHSPGLRCWRLLAS